VNLGSDGKPDINGMFPIARVDHSFHKLTLHIFEALILVNATNLRSVLKSHDLVFELERYHFGRSYNSNQFPIFWILYFIRKILGDGVALRNGIQKCIASKIGLDLYDSSDDRNHLKLGLIIPAVLIPNQMQPNQVTAEPSRYPELGGVRYKIHDENRVSFAIIHQDEGRVDIFPVLLEAIDVFQRMGHLK
jgi:hypothetical protein